MTEVYLSIRPNTGMCMALHILPTGVSYQGMHSVYLHSVRLCALTGGDMSVTALSRLYPREDHLFILARHHLCLQYLRGP